MKNYLGQVVGLSGLVMAFLLILSAVSEETSFMGFPIRKMDILSDVRPKQPVMPETDTLNTWVQDTTFLTSADTLNGDSLLVAERIPVAEWPAEYFGQNFEDYTFNQRGLVPFFAAIDSIGPYGNKVRVAFFGDSFVEGDILLGDLRDTLQGIWGGNGVGFVPITSEISRFRRSYLQEFNGFIHSSMLHPGEIRSPVGINGYAYYPKSGARFRYKGTTQYALRHTNYWSETRLFYKATQAAKFTWQSDQGTFAEVSLPTSSSALSVWAQKEPRTTGCTFKLEQSEGLTLYGAALENGPGIYFDNFSVRGNSGGKLCHIRPEMAQAFNHFQQYDLIILQFGLNAVTNSLTNIRWYQAELDKTFAHIRKCFPGTPVLVMSVPDRGGKVNGELATMISVPHIVQMQRNLARQHGFLFYDFFNGMGGPNTMVRLAAAGPPSLVNKDYTHLTHEGGRLEGLRLAALFVREKEKNDARSAK